jgi:hypothetical protein
MKHLIKAALALSLIAASNAHAALNFIEGKVMVVQFWEGHTGVLIRLSKTGDPEGCGRADYLIVQDTHPHYKDLYAMLLTSQVSRQTISLGVSGCFQGFPNVVHGTAYSEGP